MKWKVSRNLLTDDLHDDNAIEAVAEADETFYSSPQSPSRPGAAILACLIWSHSFQDSWSMKYTNCIMGSFFFINRLLISAQSCKWTCVWFMEERREVINDQKNSPRSWLSDIMTCRSVEEKLSSWSPRWAVRLIRLLLNVVEGSGTCLQQKEQINHAHLFKLSLWIRSCTLASSGSASWNHGDVYSDSFQICLQGSLWTL